MHKPFLLALPRLLALFLALCSAASAAEHYVGKWFRVSGLWTGSELNVERIQLREPEKSPERGQVSGQVETVDLTKRELRIGPFGIDWSDKTEFRNTSAAQLKAGTTLRVTGKVSNGRIAASAIEPATAMSAKAIQLTGLVTSAKEGPGTRELVLMGVPVTMTQGGYNQIDSLTRRQDARRPEQPFTTQLFGRPLTITGEYDATGRYRKNLDLAERLVTNLDHEFKLEFFYPLTHSVYLFLVGKALYEAELDDSNGHPESDASLARDQMWVYFDRLGGSDFGLQIGRQNLREAREWWWDDDLDAVRVHFDRGPFHAEFGAGQEIAKASSLDHDIRPEDKDLARFFAMGSWLWAPKQRVEVFALRQRDSSRTEALDTTLAQDREDPSDASLTWFGLRAIGNPSLDKAGDLIYWADVAAVRGREKLLGFDSEDGVSTVDKARDLKVRGFAFDVGASWETRLAGRPAFTLGYAQGSGDDNLDDGTDSSFRQTGLHANKWRFFGVNRFRFYGELTRPELSNLGIATAAVGFPLLRNSSVELVYHRYNQVKAAKSLRDFRIDADLTGNSKDLGQEVDLVLGFRDARRWDLAFTAGIFRAGDAYGPLAGKQARTLLIEFTYNF